MLLVCFICPGGYDYVQIFSELLPVDVARNPLNVSNDRTTMSTDGLLTTCLTITPHLNSNLLWIKVMPRRSYLFGNIFSLFVAGRNILCSPADRLIVTAQPACNDNGDCEHVVPCIAKKALEITGMFVCEYRCQMFIVWDFVAIHINNPSPVNIRDPELCEIWFSNWSSDAKPGGTLRVKISRGARLEVQNGTQQDLSEIIDLVNVGGKKIVYILKMGGFELGPNKIWIKW